MPVRPSWHTARNRKICADRKRDVDFQGLLPTRQRAKVGHGPVQVDEVEQAFDEPGGLSECHPEQHLHRQASLDGCVTVIRLTTALAGRCCSPGHVGIEPDRQRTAALERCVVVRPVSGLVGRGYGSAHALQLPCWIHEMNPSPDLCNRALQLHENTLYCWQESLSVLRWKCATSLCSMSVGKSASPTKNRRDPVLCDIGRVGGFFCAAGINTALHIAGLRQTRAKADFAIGGMFAARGRVHHARHTARTDGGGRSCMGKPEISPARDAQNQVSGHNRQY